MTLIAQISKSENAEMRKSKNEKIFVFINDDLVGVASPCIIPSLSSRTASPLSESSPLYFLTVQSDKVGTLRFQTEDGQKLNVQMINAQMTNAPYGEADRMNEVNKEMVNDIEGFLLSPMRDKIILIKQVKTVPSTADKYPDLPLATGHMHEDLMYKHWDEWTETAPQPFVCDLQIEYYGEGERIKSAKLG